VDTRGTNAQAAFPQLNAQIQAPVSPQAAEPGFTIARYRDRLKDLHDQIERDGVFQSTTSRTLFDIRKPPAC
jgi:hypothetical protein